MGKTTLTHEQFKALLDAYLGTRAHEDWAKDNGTTEEYQRAVRASKEARLALEQGVFGP